MRRVGVGLLTHSSAPPLIGVGVSVSVSVSVKCSRVRVHVVEMGVCQAAGQTSLGTCRPLAAGTGRSGCSD